MFVPRDVYCPMTACVWVIVQSISQDLFYVSFRSICAFLNSGKCGTVYLGIRHDGVVAGLRIDRKQVNLEV